MIFYCRVRDRKFEPTTRRINYRKAFSLKVTPPKEKDNYKAAAKIILSRIYEQSHKNDNSINSPFKMDSKPSKRLLRKSHQLMSEVFSRYGFGQPKVRQRFRRGRGKIARRNFPRMGLMQDPGKTPETTPAETPKPEETTPPPEGTTLPPEETTQPPKETAPAPEATSTTPEAETKSEASSDKKEEKPKSTEPATFSPYNIASHMHSLIDKFPKANITFETLGKTAAYNELIMLKVTENKEENKTRYLRAEVNKYADEVPEKRIVLIVHALNAMGFKGLPCLSKEDKFLELVGYYFAHLDKFHIFFMPMANPDGVAMNTNVARWNKNMSPQGSCSGVALDRNFDVAWNETRGVDSCSQQFAGPYPFSEPESQAIREVFHRYGHKIVAYLNVHSGTYNADSFKGDAVLYPRGFSEVTQDDDKYVDMRGEIDEALRNASFQILSVTVDTLYSWYGKVAGTSVDYASTIYGIPFSMELVMQIYDNDVFNEKSEEAETNVALREIWRRVIDTIFMSAHKYLQQPRDTLVRRH